MTIQDIKFAAGSEVLAGRFVLTESGQRPSLLFLHGAGRSSKERAMPLATTLAQSFGISSFLFDFSGHGESSGTLERSSLTKRVNEVHIAMNTANLDNDFSICAFSMGAHIALELIGQIRLRSLILFYPAVYPPNAYTLPFNGDFSSAIRTPDAWRQSRVFDFLRNFPGQLFVVIGDRDEIIPQDLPDILFNLASSALHKELLKIPNGTHNLLPHIYASKPLFADVCSKIGAYVLGTVAPSSQ